MSKVHFFIDNLHIGGFQRLCLDQAYVFSERGYDVLIHSLNDLHMEESRNFFVIERDLLSKFKIIVDSISSSHLIQIYRSRKIVRSASFEDIFISHSLRATVILRIAMLLSASKLKFVTEIHQLPTLSAPIQRFRRFLYSQLSPVLVAYSSAVKKDWDFRLGHFPNFARPFFSNSIEVIRNGVYLNRLPSPILPAVKVQGNRLIFLGRNTSWKGLSTFLEFAEHSKLKHFQLLLILPEIDFDSQSAIKTRFGCRLDFIIGKSISSFVPQSGDVHFYAAQYGGDAKYIESISLNCLEMAAIGVPSVVTSGGLDTWSDLQDQEIFFECDWDDIANTVEIILRASKIQYSSSTLEYIRRQVSITANVSALTTRILHIQELN